jgi:ATP-binding cassette subfamily B protein
VIAPRGVDEKPKNRRKVLRRLGTYLLQFKGWLLLAVALTLLSNLFQLIGPVLSGAAIDAMAGGLNRVDFSIVWRYAGFMLLFFTASSVISYALSALMVIISQKIIFRMRQDVFDKLMRLPVHFFDTHQTGDIISRISYDIDTVNVSLSNDLVQILTSIIIITGSFIMMIMISAKLVIVFAVTVPISILFTRYMTRKVRPLFSVRSRMLGQMNGFAEERVSGQKTIRAYGREDVVTERFDKHNEDAVEAFFRAEYYGSMTGPAVNFINNLSLALISVFGALLYLAGNLTIGNVSSFVLYSRKFSGPINEIANIFSELQSAMAAAERIFRLLDAQEEQADAADAKALVHERGEIAIRRVSFGYEADKPILTNISLTARPGSLVAIVGPTGAGKTTLINLLMRFYDPQSGSITIDGQNIRSVKRDTLRCSFAMVLQDTWLFTGTIYENIAYGSLDVTLETVMDACRAARIHSTIMRLPEGYDTVLTEDGGTISKGQKQLITIARAMLLKANMLILDEATSNVDTRTEVKIQQAMRKLMEHKTCFVIAHRLSTIQNADIILVMRDGHIVEKGKHMDLLSRKGVYAQMYQAQFE